MWVVYKLQMHRGQKMAHWEKVLATKPDHLSSVPETPGIEGDNQLLQAILGPLQRCIPPYQNK